MKLKSVTIIKQPLEPVWETMQTKLTDLVPLLDDIESVRTDTFEPSVEGSARLVNVWQAQPGIPEIVRNHVSRDMLGWTDHAEWDGPARECRWRIETHFMPESIECAGVTRYEPAMGGRGTRLTFEGHFTITTLSLPQLALVGGSALTEMLERFIGGLFPQNFMKLARAVDRYLEHENAGNS